MFTYYGSKSKIIDRYPPPKCGKIIEPFAGSARYALKFYDRDVLLVDKYPVIINIWQWLQKCSEKDILGLPTLKAKMDIRKLNISDEEKLFLGMLAGVASTSPRWTVSAMAAGSNGRKNQLKRISKQIFKIKHWQFKVDDYLNLENEEATWFIDPPYQYGGHAYVCNKIDYNNLSLWCKSRNGQIIVCENTKANWLPFYPVAILHGHANVTVEAMWTNLQTSYSFKQSSMF